MKIYKSRNVKTPERGTEKSAGLDFFIPVENLSAPIRLAPGEAVNIPSGIHVEVPENYVLIAMNKSGIALKKHLQVGACVIDEDYQGEVHIHVTNIGTTEVNIVPGEKLVQMLLLPVLYAQVELMDSKEVMWNGKITNRGAGAFGSTNK